MALQNSIHEWIRDHLMHHKYSETDIDPHNAKRGFFFSHVGWLLCKKHPDVIRKGKTIDMSDISSDPVARIQHKFYLPLVFFIWGFVPTLIPTLLWGENKWEAFFLCVMFRYCYTLNVTWLVNSAAHIFGTRPYNQRIEARETTIRHMLMGEGFHNYHHTFPWDYSASELGPMDVFNPATLCIDLFYHVGWAYDLKTVPEQMIIQKRINAKEIHKKPNTSLEWISGIIINTWPIWWLLLTRKLLL